KESSAGGLGRVRFHRLEHLAEIQSSEVLNDQEECDEEPEIADAVNEECFLACRCGGISREIESDQQVGRKAHSFPPDKHQKVVTGQYQGEHEEHEQVQVGEETIESAFLPHVSDGIDMDKEADAGDNQQHHHGKLVERESVVSLKASGSQPGGNGLDVGHRLEGRES